MNRLLMKEVRLASHPLSFIFIIFSFVFLLPGYPVLCAPFFVSLGIFQSFQKTRENGDILFTVLLPVPKRDVVKGKYLFVCLIELCSFLIMTLCTLLRGTVLRENEVFLSNPLMNANGFALSLALFIFALFNSVFVASFFRTAYNLGIPFLMYDISSFLAVALGETLHHIPHLEWIDGWGMEQIILFLAGCVLYTLMTLLSYRMSVRRFERLDL